MDIDYGLYLVTDRGFLNGRNLKECIEQAIKGGATVIQLREKDVPTKEFYEIALEVKEVTDEYKIPLIINDRVDIALAIDADGVHLGQRDMPLQIARKLIGKDKIIGVSVGNKTQAIEAEKAGADYIGIGTVFFTGTKKDINTPIGLAGLKEVCDSVSIPSVAIGGIHEGNLAEVLQTGTNGAAVVSAILGKEDIKTAAWNLKEILRSIL